MSDGEEVHIAFVGMACGARSGLKRIIVPAEPTALHPSEWPVEPVRD